MSSMLFIHCLPPVRHTAYDHHTVMCMDWTEQARVLILSVSLLHDKNNQAVNPEAGL